MDVMYIRHRLGGMSPLLPSEQVIYSLDRVRAVSLVCSAFCRGLWARSHGCGTRICVTNRRVLISSRIGTFFFYRQEVDLWFPGQQPEGKDELITAVSLREGRYGRYVEIRSRNPRRRQSWFSSPDLAVRIFHEELERIKCILCETMAENH